MTDTHYFWDGNNRIEENCFVFQYTLNGSGAIKIKETTYQLNKNQAFWIKIPSDHSYYLPPESSKWEFIYITLFGDVIEKIYQQLTTINGHIFTFLNEDSVIQLIFQLIEQIKHQQVHNSFQASAAGYQFAMAFLENMGEYKEKRLSPPKPIERVLTYMKNNYHKDISLNDCVAKSNLSKYHFTREFKKYIGTTPMQYVTKLRIQQASRLLLNDSDSIHSIAQKVGFQNGNYFTKVFKKEIGKSPNAYRKASLSIPVDHWFTD